MNLLSGCQVSSGWRPSEILSHCRVNAIGISKS
ncbi:hypothetical protein F383_25848 [Gossypium arboreum]|uniref:Uncharacterized protein n=1 Tax=Gossypium arboreum TaxID=29729 RepID=A0A0B0P6W9_GOSAR|nr:hypothetical protein F383_25848 [Gossypium arboreum]